MDPAGPGPVDPARRWKGWSTASKPVPWLQMSAADRAWRFYIGRRLSRFTFRRLRSVPACDRPGPGAAGGEWHDQCRLARRRGARPTEDGRYDFVMTLDCIHDMPRPSDAIAAIRRAIRPDGTWLIKDIRSGPNWHDNVKNPVLALMYGTSVACCMSSALSEPGGAGLGTLGFHPELAETHVPGRRVYPVQDPRCRGSRQPLLRGSALRPAKPELGAFSPWRWGTKRRCVSARGAGRAAGRSAHAAGDPALTGLTGNGAGDGVACGHGSFNVSPSIGV